MSTVIPFYVPLSMTLCSTNMLQITEFHDYWHSRRLSIRWILSLFALERFVAIRQKQNDPSQSFAIFLWIRSLRRAEQSTTFLVTWARRPFSCGPIWVYRNLPVQQPFGNAFRLLEPLDYARVPNNRTAQQITSRFLSCREKIWVTRSNLVRPLKYDISESYFVQSIFDTISPQMRQRPAHNLCAIRFSRLSPNQADAKGNANTAPSCDLIEI